MLIREIFLNKIDRDIKGVIKIGQENEEYVHQELDEYVVTKALAGHFAEFFANYKSGIVGHTDKIGVWISGFFGSGKSHLLKIIAYLLENREVRGRHALDYFVDGGKISDATVLADMKLCADTAARTDVILFNVDSKSSERDSIVSVFLKVFNEMQGYYGTRPHIAELERDLDEAGVYDEFKRAFFDVYQSEWVDSRHKFDRIQDHVVSALTRIGFMTEVAARNLCANALGRYEISIESFAATVKAYLKKKGGGWRIVFLVDEIGQYIGGDSRMMLNLQTITENLGTACRGRAWVIVTSQQDIDVLVENMAERSNDFSKIQGRFDTRLNLSSANVDEVIRKRILEKNDPGGQSLRLLYEQKETVIKNLIVFNDSVEKKLYAGENDFAAVYPFVPYQFKLLSDALTSFRERGASGKQFSDAERTMLALFREAAASLKDMEVGAIVPFSRFYNSLHNYLEHNHAGVIAMALDNKIINPDEKETCFAVEVLKALFLVKYVKDIVANTDNIVSLMADNIDADRIALKASVEDALYVLAGQNLIQKNGDAYEFLTDEEQEINRQIERQNVEGHDLAKKVSELIFEDIIKDNRYRYPAHNGRYTFAYNQFVDDYSHRPNQSHEIGVRVYTPNFEATDEMTLRMISGQGKEVLLVLPDDRSYFDELRVSMKIEKFLKKESDGFLARYEHIKSAKMDEKSRRETDAKVFLLEALKNSDIYVNGDKAQIGAKDATTRLNDALGSLVSTVYYKLTDIDGVFGETDIRNLLGDTDQQSLSFEGVKQANTNALKDMLGFIAANTARHTKTSMKTLHDRYQKAPYGFVEDDIEWLVARLFKDGDIALTISSAEVTLVNRSVDDITRYITKREFVDKLLTDHRERANESQKKAARGLMKDLYGSSCALDDDHAIMSSFQKYGNNHLQTIKEYEIISQGKPYPGRSVLETGKALIRRITNAQSTTEFFKIVHDEREALLGFAEDYRIVSGFFSGEQRKIFDDALEKMRIYDDSKTFIVDAAVEESVAGIKAILKMPSPYTEIPKLPGLVKQFTDAYMAVLEGMSKPIYEAIEDARNRVFAELERKPYKEELAQRFMDSFKELKYKAERCNNVATLQNIRLEADTLKLRLLDEIAKRDAAIIAADPPTAPPVPDGKDGTIVVAEPTPPRFKNVSIRSINTGGTWQVRSKSDIDERIDELRERLYSTLEADTILNIEF